MRWSPQQEHALRKAKQWRTTGASPYFTLAGYAGTGKTTLARHLAADAGGQVFFAAYTGKAAHVLRKTGIDASTIHKLIYLPRDKCDERLRDLERKLAMLVGSGDEKAKKIIKLRQEIAAERENLRRPDFTLNYDSPLLGASLLVLDEYSMVDQQVGRDLLSFGCPILALGDPGQLPPVRGSQYFTGEPDAMLTEIHRQAEGNPIIRMSRDVREGKRLVPGQYGSSQVLRRADVDAQALAVLMLWVDQILVGTNATRRSFNQHVRRLLGRTSPLPEVGDKLVCLRNNHLEGMLNGQIWMVGTVRPGRGFLRLGLYDEDGNKVTCLAHREYFEHEAVELDPRTRRAANEFDYGYVLTTHKSQGSQWDKVLVFDEWRGSNHSQWLYTAITRAAESVTVVM